MLSLKRAHLYCYQYFHNVIKYFYVKPFHYKTKLVREIVALIGMEWFKENIYLFKSTKTRMYI